MTDNRNTILAVILSGIVRIAWQYFYTVPQMEKRHAQTKTQAGGATPAPRGQPGPRRLWTSTAPVPRAVVRRLRERPPPQQYPADDRGPVGGGRHQASSGDR